MVKGSRARVVSGWATGRTVVIETIHPRDVVAMQFLPNGFQTALSGTFFYNRWDLEELDEFTEWVSEVRKAVPDRR